MNLDFAQEFFAAYHQDEMSFDAFMQVLKHGIAIANKQQLETNHLSNTDLNSLNIALSFNQHVLLKELIS